VGDQNNIPWGFLFGYMGYLWGICGISIKPRIKWGLIFEMMIQQWKMCRTVSGLYNLAVGLEHFFPYILGIIIPTD